ncbi:hypothetical protein TNCV_1280011 [Trichonephila clavipes]|nr:hypothetical protein TNCV_1280011 [Trichonephila clavipes]
MASKKMKTRYDARESKAGHNFHEGDKVGLWNPKRCKGLSPKQKNVLQSKWEECVKKKEAQSSRGFRFISENLPSGISDVVGHDFPDEEVPSLMKKSP